MEERAYWVYLMTNPTNQVLYTGVTGNLARRVWDHKQKLVEGFTKKYNVTKLVLAEPYEDIRDAIEREKQIKAGSRKRKIDLVETENPEWRDLNDLL